MCPRQDLVKSILIYLYFKICFFCVYLCLCEYMWELVEEVMQMWGLGTELWASGRAGGACRPAAHTSNTVEEYFAMEDLSIKVSQITG